MKLSHDELKGLMKNKLMQAGLKADHADMTADVLTWSDERGYHSHGAVRVEYYSERIAKGGITVETYNNLNPQNILHVVAYCNNCRTSSDTSGHPWPLYPQAH